MATLEPATRTASRERGHSSNYSIRSPTEHERGSATKIGAIRNPDENENHPAMPKGLGGMLKTTTETGDIELFSIKPSRVPLPVNSPRRVPAPYSDNGMRRPRQFQPYGVPNIDDRRRLPSYARDASSEVISMYETASQKSAGRGFDDPDYRSYSMTQTYSSYSLSNHRSYASLRSQPDAGRLLQRPRSPFAYPTRLKRPGFRPSSPAMTDGGAIDYSRRAEIDRTTYGANHHISSPASLYAQKRRPQLSLRPEANRSTTSLLSQSSPKRRSPSPNARQRSGSPVNDWQQRNGPGSMTTSPARSTLSLASTVHICHTAHAPISINTPGKIPPPSPLYYDYTEEFDIDDYNQSEPLEPPPQFRVGKTIPEDRPLSSAWTPLDGSGTKEQKPIFNNILRKSSSATSIFHKSLNFSQDSSTNTHSKNIFDPTQGHSSHEAESVLKDSTVPTAVNSEDRKTIRLSGLGLGARELSTHVEEAFGLPPTASFEVLVSNSTTDDGNLEKSNMAQEENENGTHFVRNSSYSLNTPLGHFPPPPRNLDGQFSETDNDQVFTVKSRTEVQLANIEYQGDSISYGGEKGAALGTTGETSVGDAISPFPPRSSSLQSDRKRLSRPYSIGNGLTELDQLINAFEEANRKKAVAEKRHIQDSTKFLPLLPSVLPDALFASRDSSAQRFPPHSSFNQLAIDNGNNGREALPNRVLKTNHPRQRPRRLEAVTVPIGSENDVPNFSHQFPRKLMSRSESPMLAPKPISPARQLKLKNSVPQLMKALPALPPDPSMCAISPPLQLVSSDIELPCRFSPLLPEPKSAPPQEPSRSADSPKNHPVASAERLLEPVELDSIAVTAQISEQVKDEQRIPTPPPPPKLKLKMRSSSALRPTSTLESRPWNSEDSYPWSGQIFSVGLPSVVQEDKLANPKQPKFKLKITRASNSTVGTVRVNRESGDSRTSVALHLRRPKDLFTPNSGIDNIFRQVSRHLHSRKPSASSINHHPTQRRPPKLMSAPISDQISLIRSVNSGPIRPQLSQTSLNAASPNEVRSFFSDDSSHRHVGGRRLGKRISNLRARIVAPYGAANGTQSHGDITWRGRNGQESLRPAASRSIPDLHEGRADHQARRPRRLSERVHAQKLRARFTLWFKGATSAIRARVKSRKGAGMGDDE